MAKGRMLDKSISASYQIHDLPDWPCKLLATWLIAHLDKNGVFYGDAPMVRSQVFPLEDVTNAQVEEWLQAMENATDGDGEPLMVRFSAQGRLWQYWPGFDRHQAGLRKDRERTNFPTPPVTQELVPDNCQAIASILPDNCQATAGNVEDEYNIIEPNYNITEDKSNRSNEARSDERSSTFTSNLSPGQSAFLALFGAKRYKNGTQRNAVLELETTHGIEPLLSAGRWAATKGMSLGDAIGAVTKVLPTWGTRKTGPPGGGDSVTVRGL